MLDVDPALVRCINIAIRSAQPAERGAKAAEAELALFREEVEAVVPGRSTAGALNEPA